MKIGRRDLAFRIYSKLDGAISKSKMVDIVNVIVDSIEEDVMNGRSVSIDNFGTFSSFMYHGHRGYDIHTKKVEYHQPFRSVRFNAHRNMSKVILDRRARFLK